MSTPIASLPSIRPTAGWAAKNPRGRGTVTLALPPLLAALAALLLLVVLAGPAASQQATGLVSNTGQTAGTAAALNADNAQAFTTGSNSAGYTLTRVDMKMSNSGSNPANYMVSVHEDSSGLPGNSLGTLNNPTLSSTVELVEFSASSGIDLAASSTYWVVIDASGTNSDVKLEATSSNAEDSGGQADWSIGNQRRWRDLSDTTWGTNTNAESLQIAIVGNAKASTPTDTTPPGAQSATVDGATLSISFNEALNTTVQLSTASFTVTVDGAPRAISSIAYGAPPRNRHVDITLSAAVAEGQRVVVSYDPAASASRLQDAFGNEVAGFTRTVANAAIPGDAPGPAPQGYIWHRSVVVRVEIDRAGWSRFESRFGDNCWDEMAAAVAAAAESSGRTPEDAELGLCQRFLAEDIDPLKIERRTEWRLERVVGATR